MTAADRLYRWLNNGTFDEQTGCSHPLDVIAVAIGCSERTVIRCTKQLETEGRIRVSRPRRRGQANTYWVSCWNPAKRCGVLAVLAGGRSEVLRRREIKAENERRRLARKAECHPKENSNASKGATAPGPSPRRCSSWRTSAVDRARPRCEFCGLEIERTRMSRPPPRRLAAVPDLLCESCQRYAEELAAKAEIIQKLARENSELAEKYLGATAAAEATGRSLVAVKGERTKRAKAAVTAEQVTEVIDCWCEHRPKTRREESFPEGGKRWEMIEKALALMAAAEVGPVEALKEAVRGLHLCPYLVYGKRAAKGRKEDLRVRPEDCFRDEIWLERARSAYRWAKALPAERVWVLYDLSASFSEGWFRLAADAASQTVKEDNQ